MSVYFMTKNWTDKKTGAVRQLDSYHSHIHESRAFSVAHSATGIGSTGQSYLIETPEDKLVHFKPCGVGINSGRASFQIRETATMATGTTAGVEPVNRNREDPKSTGVKVSLVDGSTSGSIIGGMMIYGGAGPGKAVEGQHRGETMEWVLKKNHKYNLRVASETTDSIDFCIAFLWYEHDD